MLVKGKARPVIAGIVTLAVMITVALISCDKRHGIDPIALQLGDVDDILIALNPPQLYLPSSEVIDTAIVLIAVVNEDGVGMEDVDVRVNCSPPIGLLTQPSSTDSMGTTYSAFVTAPGVYGVATIEVTAGSKSATRDLYVSGPSEYSMSLNYSPPEDKLIDHEGDPYDVTVTLVDTTQRGVAGQQVIFSILNRVGRISFEDTTITIPLTNVEGMATALFYNTRDDEINNPDSALIQAVTDPTNPVVATVAIPLRQVQNSLSLEAVPPTVFGDGSDSTLIRAFLYDTDGLGIALDTIIFSNPDHDGSYQAVAITDGTGMAISTFRPFADRTGLTEIVAAHRENTIHEATDRVDVDILPVRAIALVTVSLQKYSIIANGVDSSTIFITVQDSSGGLIADGTSVFLENTGIGRLTATHVQTINGQVVSAIEAPPNIESGPIVDSIFVWGNSSDTTIAADTVVVTYIPDVVDRLHIIRPDSTVTLIAGSQASDTLQVSALDANGNPVANGTQVSFVNEIPSSTINPPTAATVDGIATAVYLVGSETGDDNVRAFVRDPYEPTDTIWSAYPAAYHIISSEATTLVLSASETSIKVGGASCQIIATLQDANGNPLSEGYFVAFEIKSANGSRSVPYEWPSFDTEWGVYYDTVETSINGAAVVQIYSGTKAGPVSIEACTIPLPPDSLFVCDEKSLITISSGPPFHVEASPAPVGEATNPAYPERFVQVGAGVWDVYANPVEYGTAVYFSLIPNDIAEVEGDSYTGGARPYHPDSADGWAFSRIIYGCYGTFDTLQLVAMSAGGDNGEVADTSAPFPLPAYNPSIFLSANPGNLRCAGPNSWDCDQSDITALLTDGGGCPVQHGIINFAALVAGTIIGPTEVITDENGIAETEYEICGDEIPTPPDDIPRIETAVRAILFGYPDVEAEVDLVCTRPQ
jgi:hypothetical protein